MKMGQAEVCPSGAEITTRDECDSALQHAAELGITNMGRTSLVAGSWGHVPYQCSYQHGGDQAFHFNSNQTNNVDDFLNGEYHMICKNGKYILNLNFIIVNRILLKVLDIRFLYVDLILCFQVPQKNTLKDQ